MKAAKIKILFVIFFALSLAFKSSETYEEEMVIWKQKRLDALKSENGWLNLAGLFYLKEGENTIGTGAGVDIDFPKAHAQVSIGKVILSRGSVRFEATEGVEVLSQNKPIKSAIIYGPNQEAITLTHQSLRWFIIKRGDKYALRLRDLSSEYVQNFKGLEYFDLNPLWRLKAEFIPTPGKSIRIVDITGRVYDAPSPGKLAFQVNGKSFELAATSEGEELFIVFGDLTNKKSTYGGGRFLYTSKPDAERKVLIDFNKAFNPPCVFTPFATCPLPIQANKMNVEVPVGERYTHQY